MKKVLILMVILLITCLDLYAVNQVVTNNNDSGPGSLRQAIYDVGTGEEITFASDYTITLASELTINKSMTITGTGAGKTIIQANANPNTATYRVFYVYSASAINVTFTNMTIRNGNVTGVGGGIYNYDDLVTISYCIFNSNTASNDGGGIYNNYYGTISISNSTITGNTASAGSGGGLFNYGSASSISNSTFSSNSAYNQGGGIYNLGTISTMSTSTISGNEVTAIGAAGGGIYNLGPFSLSNCTISGNTCNVYGGGIYTVSTISLNSSTIANNYCVNNGGGVFIAGGSFTIINTIIANNYHTISSVTADDYYYSGGSLTDNGYNLVEITNIGAGSGGFTNGTNNDIVGEQANLNMATSLANNNTLNDTKTLALSNGSVAINSGSNSGTPSTDQRGFSRVGTTDIGAYEYQASIVSFTDGSSFSPTITPGGNNQAFGRFQLTGSQSGVTSTAATIKLNGSRTGLSNFKFWESTDGTFEGMGDSDTQLGSTVEVDPGEGNSVSYSSFSSNITTGGIYYFITCDVASDATGSIQAIIVSNSSLTLWGGELTGSINNAVLSDGEEPLPVEMSSFSAIFLRGKVRLNWTTESEKNNSGFDIERKQTDNKNWGKIDFVEGHGTVNTPQNYLFEDKNLTAGKYNYRLKQIDYNGNFEYFNLNNDVLVGAPLKFIVSQNYPNPFNPKTKINFDLPFDSRVNIKIFDMLGREIIILIDDFIQSGYHIIEFDGSNLPSGMYFYRINAGEFINVKTMLLVK